MHANADAADACYGQLIFDHIDLHVMGCPVGGNPPPLPAAVWLLYLQDFKYLSRDDTAPGPRWLGDGESVRFPL